MLLRCVQARLLRLSLAEEEVRDASSRKGACAAALFHVKPFSLIEQLIDIAGTKLWIKVVLDFI